MAFFPLHFPFPSFCCFPPFPGFFPLPLGHGGAAPPAAGSTSPLIQGIHASAGAGGGNSCEGGAGGTAVSPAGGAGPTSATTALAARRASDHRRRAAGCLGRQGLFLSLPCASSACAPLVPAEGPSSCRGDVAAITLGAPGRGINLTVDWPAASRATRSASFFAIQLSKADRFPPFCAEKAARLAPLNGGVTEAGAAQRGRLEFAGAG